MIAYPSLIELPDINTVKSQTPISTVIGSYVDLRRAGGQLIGRCPFHDDSTPSLSVSDAKGVFNCFGCQATGDVFEFVRRIEGIDNFIEVLLRVQDFTGPGHARPLDTRTPDTARAAIQIWNESTDIAGTAVERYLLKRGIPAGIATHDAVRHARLPFRGSGERHPALVAAIRNVEGAICGIQRTFLTNEGEKLDSKAKMSLGTVKGGAIRLGASLEDIIVCEGLEDGLSLRHDLPDVAVWVAAGAGMMRSMTLPAQCRRVVIASDNDVAGQQAAEAAARAFSRGGREAQVMTPSPQYKDFNAELMARGE